MEKRSLIAFILVGILTALLMWHLRAMQQQQQQVAPQDQADNSDQTQQPAGKTPDEKTTPASPDEPREPPETVAPIEPVETVETAPLKTDIRFATRGSTEPKCLVAFSNEGACITEARLTTYRETLKEDSADLLLLTSSAGQPGSLMLRDPSGRLPLDTQRYTVAKNEDGEIQFAWTFDDGLRITKTFISEPEQYEMRVRIALENVGDADRTVQYEILSAAHMFPEGSSRIQLTGAVGAVRESGRFDMKSKTPRKLKKGPLRAPSVPEKRVIWVGASNRYFAAALIPSIHEDSDIEATAAADWIESASLHYLPPDDTGVESVYGALLTRARILAPGERIEDEYVYFMGPKRKDILGRYPHLTGIQDFGMFGIISRFLLVLLNLFHKLVPNFGVGIILITILVKAILHPVAKKGQISMHKMQKLQPLIKEIQEKYKNDKQRLSREQMGLFRKHNVNPMSGCLPIFFQLPVFLGLFRMLQNSVELRHEGFALWVNDLSRADTIATIGSFPINILPVLMVISWVVQQSTMPKPADPQQVQTQKMMKIMPIVFGFMLYSMPSGLTLYWLTSTFLGILEQKLIKIEIAKMDEHGDFPNVDREVAAREQAARLKKRRK